MIVLEKDWPIKKSIPLSWNYADFENIKSAFWINGSDNFCFKVKQIKRVLLWSKNILIIDTGEDFYYTCDLLPKKLIKRIKKGDSIDILIGDPYNNRVDYYKKYFSFEIKNDCT